jgi:hypothetical protein
MYVYMHTHTYAFLQATSELPVSITYPSNSLSGPSSATYKISPLDPQDTLLTIGQEVASPVLTMSHSPGSHFTGGVQVSLPVYSKISQWYTGVVEAQTLAALEQRRVSDNSRGMQGTRQQTPMHEVLRHPSAQQSPWSMFNHGTDTDESASDDSTVTVAQETRRMGSHGARRLGTISYTELLLSWFNLQTLSWVPVKAGSINGGNLVSEIPPDVMNNPAFSGKVANLLITTTMPPEVPMCGEFQDLVGGRIPCYLCSCICSTEIIQATQSKRIQSRTYIKSSMY